LEAVPELLVAVIVNVTEPADVAVPDTTPVAESNVRPAGRTPEDTANVIDPVPVVVTVAEYAVPTVAAGSDAVVIDGTTSVTRTVYGFESVPALFVAVIVNVTEPAEVAVPDTTPVAEFKTSPAGRTPDDTVNVMDPLPVAATTAEYAVPTVAAGSEPVVIDGTELVVVVVVAAKLKSTK
jgi:hypothetical protein